MKHLVIMTAISLFLASLSASAATLELEHREPSFSRWLSGNALGTFAGFGIGHIVKREWTKTGWVFTTLELGGAGMVIGGGVWFLQKASAFEARFQNHVGAKPHMDLTEVFAPWGVALGGIVLFGAGKIAEIVDLWSAPYSSETALASSFTPVVSPNYCGLALNF